ncbi:unnamed protein product, partial [Iphiclides podalirius]
MPRRSFNVSWIIKEKKNGTDQDVVIDLHVSLMLSVIDQLTGNGLKESVFLFLTFHMNTAGLILKIYLKKKLVM